MNYRFPQHCCQRMHTHVVAAARGGGGSGVHHFETSLIDSSFDALTHCSLTYHHLLSLERVFKHAHSMPMSLATTHRHTRNKISQIRPVLDALLALPGYSGRQSPMTHHPSNDGSMTQYPQSDEGPVREGTPRLSAQGDEMQVCFTLSCCLYHRISSQSN